MWDKRVAKFNSSNSQRFKCSGTAESACHRPVSSPMSCKSCTMLCARLPLYMSQVPLSAAIMSSVSANLLRYIKSPSTYRLPSDFTNTSLYKHRHIQVLIRLRGSSKPHLITCRTSQLPTTSQHHFVVGHSLSSFHTDVTAEVPRVKMDRKMAISLQPGHFDPKFHIEVVAPPTIIFARLVRPMNALKLCHWQFSHRCYGWGATSENRSKNGDFAATRSLWSKISGTRGRPHQSFLHG